MDRVIFVKIGHMHFYNGSQPGDKKPIGGGKYNRHSIGHEVYNFKNTGGKLFGYFQPYARNVDEIKVNFKRIDPKLEGAQKINGVTIVFVATRPKIGGAIIVGWYKNAVLHRTYQDAKRSQKREDFSFNCECLLKNAVLLPDANRYQIYEKTRDRENKFGESNIFYPLTSDFEIRNIYWVNRALKFVNGYQKENLLKNYFADGEHKSAAEIEAAVDKPSGQGFNRDPESRSAIENHSMTKVRRFYERKSYEVENVSKSKPYDLHCTSGRKEVLVEVKGSSSECTKIVLTYNEVELMKKRNVVLAIVENILVDKVRGKFKCSAGRIRIVDPLVINPKRLKPVNYIYEI